MKIIVFGATGRVGSAFVDQASRAGHDTSIYVRDPGAIQTPGLVVIKGDVRDSDAVAKALAPGFDAVISCIGQTVLKPSSLVADGSRSIISGMRAAGIERFLAVSGTAEMPQKTFWGKAYTSLLRQTPVGHAIADHDKAFAQIASSGLKWTLAGCNYIKNGSQQRKYRKSLIFPGGFKIIHPPDVADFLLQELTDNRFHGEIVGIWY